MKKFVEGLPKIELHCHIEGTFEPALMFEIAKRNNIVLPYPNVEKLKDAYNFSSLQDFLNIYYQGMNVLQTEQDFYDLTWAYLEKIHSQNVRHTEIFFDPQGHVSRGIAFDTAVAGISTALETAEIEFGISSQLIMCFLRHLDEEDAFRTLEMAEPHKDRIIAVGLDSSEVGNPPEKFERVFAAARKQGYLCVAHAGEEGPPEYIYSALEKLMVNRIDHGNSCLQDPKLVERLESQKTPLTICPLSNTRLCVVDDMKNHPLKTMLDHGLKATINSDDPAYFGGYMNENILSVISALNLSKKNLAQLMSNAIEAAFVGDTIKTKLATELENYMKN